ncbi:MAG: hypothetical protein A2589_00220 [Candidatus Vogelbacteria bacterium RIFOXYD1_FULL_46_19]|uniref:DUF5667 domain-containing protein n=1 Tax=Candidatus Vogelbacteria bacterium RIFOXYD1_FULL_46_19 TaxID=1802439 RepID=A0A1G2QHQ1_9BACT|nr:MAG: hypothetical protein A2589_00220 [Candidatus Vogelbacteria bacterium RIFOXYD1_FULL_46_19]
MKRVAWMLMVLLVMATAVTAEADLGLGEFEMVQGQGPWVIQDYQANDLVREVWPDPEEYQVAFAKLHHMKNAEKAFYKMLAGTYERPVPADFVVATVPTAEVEISPIPVIPEKLDRIVKMIESLQNATSTTLGNESVEQVSASVVQKLTPAVAKGMADIQQLQEEMVVVNGKLEQALSLLQLQSASVQKKIGLVSWFEQNLTTGLVWLLLVLSLLVVAWWRREPAQSSFGAENHQSSGRPKLSRVHVTELAHQRLRDVNSKLREGREETSRIATEKLRLHQELEAKKVEVEEQMAKLAELETVVQDHVYTDSEGNQYPLMNGEVVYQDDRGVWQSASPQQFERNRRRREQRRIEEKADGNGKLAVIQLPSSKVDDPDDGFKREFQRMQVRG